MIFKDKKQPRIVYMGTPEISAYVLNVMIEEGFNVIALITNEDKEVGRKKVLEPTPTKKVALEHEIPVFQPHRIRLDYEWLGALHADVIVCMAYGQIVPQAVLDMPKHGCINLHGSLLPKLRGAAPIQRSIMNGDALTGITLMQMIDKMDAGLIYDKIQVTIDPRDNFSSLAPKMADAAAKLILKDLMPYLNGKLHGIPQEEDQVTFADKIKPENEHLPLCLSARDLVNYVRALSETPGAFLMLDGQKMKIYAAHVSSPGAHYSVGTIAKADRELQFQAFDGLVTIDSLQLEGKKKMDARSFLNGARDLTGKILQ